MLLREYLKFITWNIWETYEEIYNIYIILQLIKVNQPDLVLFVGEALVGNEAVDQLTKFNQALADHSNMTNPRLIDGIILTKFDTIDDKVHVLLKLLFVNFI